MKLIFKRNCKFCGIDINRLGPKAEFCSGKCAKKFRRWNNLEEKKCLGCGKTFTGTVQQKYCSHGCAIKSKVYEHICEICGKKFTSKSPKSSLCSEKCSHTKNRVHIYFDRKCKICNKPFRTLFPTKIYCSEDCKLKAKYIQQGCKLVIYKLKCIVCGKEVSSKHKTRKFCSEQCRKQFHHPNTTFEFNCEFCGRIFSTKSPHQKYCSTQCRKRHEYIEHNEKYRAKTNQWREEHGLIDARRELMMRVVRKAEKKYHDKPGNRVKNDEFIDSIKIYRVNGQKCKCLACNNTFILPMGCKALLRRHSIVGRSPCPYCGNPLQSRDSQAESEIQELYPEFTEQQVRLLSMDGMEIDLYDPKTKTGVEYNGLYWHSTKFKEDHNFHKKKADRADKEGINLIQVNEVDWNNRKSCVIGILDAIFGKNMKTIRKVSFTKISDMESAMEFLDKNHIHGRTFFNTAIGMYEGNDFVGLCCFSHKPIIGWVIERYATKIHTEVIGGIAGCIRHFSMLNPEVDSITFYADRRWGKYFSKIAEETGFVEEAKTKPEFMYTDLKPQHGLFSTKEVYGMIKATKGKKSIKEFVKEKGFYQIYDAGKIRYKLKIN